VKNIEIEAKMRLTDRAAMERRLAEVGATPIARLIETNTFFDTPEGRLKSSDQGLRIRVETDEQGGRRVIMTHKGPRAHGQLKSRTETEVQVDDARHAAAMLDALGFRRGLSFEKRRSRWRLDACNVELDTLPYLGQFIEIEGPSDHAILAVRQTLGLAEAALIRTSYIAMLVAYVRENNISAQHIAFKDAVSPQDALA